MPIQVLPEQLINQIAAGEVIVRPANAVKELVENSLDAGATHISVLLGNGGRDIRITDDGHGMGPEDAALALTRHATSKIQNFEDLYRLTTRGFRGEALASIAAVARVSLLTRRDGDLAGTLVTSDGGAPPTIRPAGAPTGTTIQIRDLFFNTPARLKFLKAASSETTAILTMITRLAIAKPAIGFLVSGAETTYLDLPRNQSWAMRAASLLGIEKQVDQLLPVDFSRNHVRVHGFVAPPTITGSDRRRQHFLLDGRPIVSRTLSQVLQEAYRGILMVGRFPWCVLDIVVPEGEVDINVHPSKEEVRFRQESAVTGTLYRAVQAALREAHMVPEADLQHGGTTQPAPGPTSIIATQPSAPLLSPAYQPELLPLTDPFPSRTPRPNPPAGMDLSGLVTATGPQFPGAGPVLATSATAKPLWTAEDRPRPQSPEPSDPTDRSDLSERSDPSDPIHPSAALPVAQPESTAEEAVFQWLHQSGQAPEPLGQVADCYIIARAGETLLLIDQHAAHERIQYARLSAATAPVPSQPLLIPLTLDVPPEIVPALNQALPLLAWFGFETAHFGGQTFVVQSTPGDLLPRLDPMALLQDLLDDLSSPDTRTRPNELHQMRDRIITRMSCRSAIKAGQTLHMEEMSALLRDLATTPLGTNCPHGRPTMITLTRHSLDKLFKRIV